MSKPERERSQLKMSIVLTSEEKFFFTAEDFLSTCSRAHGWRKIRFLHTWRRL